MQTEGFGVTDQRYDRIGKTYRTTRSADPRIEVQIKDALGDAKTVLNVGAGTGSYELKDRAVVALEPSLSMIRQRSADAAPAVAGIAEQLPFRDDAFDVVMGILTMHHWSDQKRGLAELRRVSCGSVVVLTWTPDAGSDFWFVRDYFPAALELDRAQFPTEQRLRDEFGAKGIEPVPIPEDCIDGFQAAYWKRPEAYLSPEVQGGISTFARLAPADVEAGLALLEADLNSGGWQNKNAALLDQEEADLGYRLVTF